MNERHGPSEAWYRDAAYNNPSDLIYRALVEDRGHHDFLTYDWQRFREYHTAAGRIDLLLVSPKAMLIVEFKRDTANEDAVAQVLRYKGSLSKVNDFATQCEIVCAVVAPAFTDYANYAASASGVRLIAARTGISYENIRLARRNTHEDLVRILNPLEVPSAEHLAALPPVSE